jgi:hypothetical protein
MTDAALAAAVAILAAELAPVSDAMIEAGSRALDAAAVGVGPDGKRRLRQTSEACDAGRSVAGDADG